MYIPVRKRCVLLLRMFLFYEVYKLKGKLHSRDIINLKTLLTMRACTT